MRNEVVLVAGVLLAACSGGERQQEKADARVAATGFTPPSVTSRLDFGGMVERRFRQLDRDGNDVISADELPSRNARALRFDRNGDGQVSNEEYGDGMLATFDRVDANRDGTVTSDERQLEEQRRAAAGN